MQLSYSEIKSEVNKRLSNRVDYMDTLHIANTMFAFQELNLKPYGEDIEPFLDKLNYLRSITHNPESDGTLGHFEVANTIKQDADELNITHPFTINMSPGCVNYEAVLTHETLHLLSTTGEYENGYFIANTCGLKTRNIDEAATESDSRNIISFLQEEHMLGTNLHNHQYSMNCENNMVSDIQFSVNASGYDIMIGYYNAVNSQFSEELHRSKYFGESAFEDTLETASFVKAAYIDYQFGNMLSDATSKTITAKSLADSCMFASSLSQSQYVNNNSNLADYLEQSSKIIKEVPNMTLNSIGCNVNISEFAMQRTDLKFAQDSPELKSLGISARDFYPDTRSDVANAYLMTMSGLRDEYKSGTPPSLKDVKFQIINNEADNIAVKIDLGKSEMLSVGLLHKETNSVVNYDYVETDIPESSNKTYNLISKQSVFDKMKFAISDKEPKVEELSFSNLSKYNSLSRACDSEVYNTKDKELKAVNLMASYYNNNKFITETLTKVNPYNIIDKDNQNLLHLACELQSTDKLSLDKLAAFEAAHPDKFKQLVSEKDDFGLSPFDYAILKSKFETANYIKDRVPEIETNLNMDISIQNSTILINSIEKQDFEAVKLCTSTVSDLDQVADNGKTALTAFFQLKEHDYRILNLLEDCDMNTKDAAGNTPIMYAINNENQILVNFAIEHGADLNISNNYNKNALDMIKEHSSLCIEKEEKDYTSEKEVKANEREREDDFILS